MEEAESYTTGTVQKETHQERLGEPQSSGITATWTCKTSIKIKLRGAGYRLVYRVEDDIVTVTVIGVGKRENDDIYNAPLIAIDECCQALFWGRIRAYFLSG